MLKIKYLLITLVIFAVASADLTAGGKKSQPVEIRVGTYNIWRSDLGKDDYRWEVRKERLVKSILDCNIDIFAAEEVDTTIFREIPGMLENYAWLVFSPYSPDGSGSMKAQAIVYRKDKFKPLNFNHFWLSPTPDEMS